MLAPFWVEVVGVAGVGGADNRLKMAKFTMSEDISEAVPIVVPKFGLLELPFRMFVASSGEPLNTHPATALRSLGNNLVRHALFHVVSLSHEHQQRFVLCLPAETRNGAVVAAGIEDCRQS